MPELDLEAIKARCEAATPGLWEIFIAHARKDVLMLVAEVERLRAALTKESDRVLELSWQIDEFRSRVHRRQ